jgi:phenylacetate-CoA ligase
MDSRRTAFNLKMAVTGRESRRVADDLLAAERLTEDQLRELTASRSIDHARFAMQHSEFYRTYYSDHGLRLTDLDDPAAFTALPLIDKHIVREHFEGLKTDEATPKNTAVSRTGGSTGLPLHILRDERFPARALEWRLFRWWGVGPWEHRAIVTRHMQTGMSKLRHDLAWLPSRRVQLDAFKITDEAVTAFADQWNSIRPAVLVGYGGGVLDTVRRLGRLGLTLRPPKAVALTAAPLAAGVRSEIEAFLKAPVFDHYRSAEVPWIGGECEQQDGLHVFADIRRVEILDDTDVEVMPGTEANVVVSDLTNRAFPLLRYRLGDISSYRPEACGCGRPLPRLGPISGRASDAVRLPDGTTIAGALGHIFDDDPYSIKQFEIVQSEDYSIVLRCITAGRPGSPAAIEKALAKLKTAARGAVPVSLEMVEEIPQVGGKMRFIRSAAPVPPR